VGELTSPSDLLRNHARDPERSLDDAVWLIEHMCEHLGLADLANVDLLDWGCGMRFAQAFLNRGVPVGHYVGVDAAGPIIGYLQQHVSDPRFEFVYVNIEHGRYNPSGAPLSSLVIPELEGRQFDQICLFSVFTHLSPPDFEGLLRLLRRLVTPAGRLFFSLFINERTEGGHGYADRASAGLPEPPMKIAAPDYIDADPSRPLWVALYSRRHARSLIERSGWRILEISPPTRQIQHHVVCSPA
jgi:SAM-dependent methyltransferase